MKTETNIDDLAWPAHRLGEVMEFLVRKAGLIDRPASAPALTEDPTTPDENTADRWIAFGAEQLAVEAESVSFTYPDVDAMIQKIGPALVRLPGENSPGFLAILKGRSRLSVIGPDLSIRRISSDVLRNALTRDLEASIAEKIDNALDSAGVPEARRERARRSILREQLSDEHVGGCWLLRLSPGTNFLKQLRRAKIPGYLSKIVVLLLIAHIFNIFGWWVIGGGALSGSFEKDLLYVWGMVLFTAVPFQIFHMWLGSLLAIGSGSLFKRRLLFGSMQLEPEEIRDQGAGQFLGRIMESEALDSMALESGFVWLNAILQLFIAGWVLSKGAGGWTHALPLFGWMCVAFLISWRFYGYYRQWVFTYQEMTNDLVERMVGHRTRLAQEDHVHWHDEEDRILDRYLNLSEQKDRIRIHLNAFISHGWMIIGLAGIAWVFITEPESKAKLAVSLGGILLASQALTAFVDGVKSIIAVKLAWEQAGPLFKAASRQTDISAVLPGSLAETHIDGKQPLLVMRDVVFRYQEHGRTIVKDCRLSVYKGDRLLLEGPSGGGKSTLAALAAGLRFPESGLMLLRGMDRQTMGIEQWRKRIVSAPQFHENHVFTGTFAFNLLMGRVWPPKKEDLEEAETVCRELGLGNLLDKMPAGLQQMVGESGWQLSHGEQSRLFIARALLQKSDIIILDESFAALDPENLAISIKCVFKRAPALVVIAHP